MSGNIDYEEHLSPSFVIPTDGHSGGDLHGVRRDALSGATTSERLETLPMAIGMPTSERHPISYWQGICLVISRQIGVGIFSTPAVVNRSAGTIGMSLIVWMVTGFLAYAGASIQTR